jgi:serine/threonine protein kinase
VLRLVESQGVSAVLKDYSSSRWWFRHTVGWLLAVREAAAYRALRDVPGVPRLLTGVSWDGLLLEYVDGPNCRKAAGPWTPLFFQQLSELLRAVRQRGVLHLDVKRNVLVSRDGRPFLIDFATSIVLPSWLGPLRRLVLRLAADYDEQDVARLKRLLAPHLFTSQDEGKLMRRLPLAGLVRFLQEAIQRPVRWLTGQQPRPLQSPIGGEDHHASAA